MPTASRIDVAAYNSRSVNIALVSQANNEQSHSVHRQNNTCKVPLWPALSMLTKTSRSNTRSTDNGGGSYATVGSPLTFPSSNNTGTMAQASPGKLDRLRRTPAGSTAFGLDECGLRD